MHTSSKERARRVGGPGLALLATLAAGCGGDSGPPRLAVAGTIRFDGKPLDKGTITFLPVQAGPAATAEIAAGDYQIGSSEGPGTGPYTVEIVADVPTGKQVKNPDLPGETIAEVKNVIPRRYNSATELRAEVKAEGENRFNFDLVAEKKSAGRPN